MSDAQFSSLSPDSSNGLSNRYVEDDLNDQETVSIISNQDDNHIANLNDFDDFCDKLKVDPFLSEFMKEDADDNINTVDKLKNSQFYDNSSAQNYMETNDLNNYYYSTTVDSDLDEYLSVQVNGLEDVSSDILQWIDPPPTNSLESKSVAYQNSNKRSFTYQDTYSFEKHIKQRKIEICPQIRCHEWINKLNKTPENFSFKASGLLDRRKTKHHQILNDQDTDLYEENTAHQKHEKPYVNKKPVSVNLSPISIKLTSIKKPLSISIISSRDSRFRQITASRNSRRSFTSCSDDSNSEKNVTNTSLSSVSMNPHLITLSNSIRSTSDIFDISRIPEPLRMGKRVNRRGQRFALWQFLMCLLDSNRYKEHKTGIRWIHRSSGIFHIVDSKQVATLWGQYKERKDKMTYDSLARSLRHYYKKNLMAKINNRRLVYQIAQECLQWSSETFIKRNRD